MSLLPALHKTASELENSFDELPQERKELLLKLSAYIRQKQDAKLSTKLVFICTHNSRRSHIAQIWAQAAATHYGIKEVYTYSGGTEATAFNPNAVQAMQQAGFNIVKNDDSTNPKYTITFSDKSVPLQVWSKAFDDKANPSESFCAIMTCTDADENCPFVPGTDLKLAVTYNDPKASDGTPDQEQVYLERARQIGTEILFAFSKV
jgi:arsenate reductase (thioredoxin)